MAKMIPIWCVKSSWDLRLTVVNELCVAVAGERGVCVGVWSVQLTASPGIDSPLRP